MSALRHPSEVSPEIRAYAAHQPNRSSVSNAPGHAMPRTGGLQEPVSHTKGRDMPPKLTVIAEQFSDEETIRRINRYIENPPENSRVFTVTPGVAGYILENYNRGNRPRKPGNIATYSDYMAARAWALTGDTIKFSTTKLLDGQNRLMSCVRSGVPFTTHFAFGIAEDAFSFLDQGKNRDGSEVLSIAGHANTRSLAAAVRWAYLLEAGRTKQRDTLKPNDTLRLLNERFTKLPTFINQAQAVYRISNQPVGLVAALLHLFSQKNPAKAQQFADAWAAGEQGGAFSVLGKLQKEMGRLASVSSGRVHDVVRAALIVRAWNAFVEGRKGNLSDFSWKPSDVFPAVEG